MTRFQTSDGLSLAWEEEGTGLPLLCLPGLTRNARDFDDLAAVLDGRGRLIRLTLRGRGASDRDPDFRNYNPGIETRDVVEFLDHLGLPKVTVIGTSRGGLIAMVMAVAARDRLAGVLLNDIGPELVPDGMANIMSYLGVAPQVDSFEALAQGLEARMGARFPGLSAARWLELAHRWFEADPAGGVRLNYDPKLRDAVEALSALPAADLWPLFDAFGHLPVAVVRGANSDLLSADIVARMQARRPDLIVAEVPDRGHVPFLDEPEALAALDALLARVAAD